MELGGRRIADGMSAAAGNLTASFQFRFCLDRDYVIIIGERASERAPRIACRAGLCKYLFGQIFNSRTHSKHPKIPLPPSPVPREVLLRVAPPTCLIYPLAPPPLLIQKLNSVNNNNIGIGISIDSSHTNNSAELFAVWPAAWPNSKFNNHHW